MGRGSKLRLRARFRLTELSNRRRQHRHCCSGVYCPRHASPGVRGTTRRVEGSYKLQNHRVIIDDFGWRPRRDLNPCYRRESGMAKRNFNKLQEHGRTGWRSRNRKKHLIVSPMCPRPHRAGAETGASGHSGELSTGASARIASSTELWLSVWTESRSASSCTPSKWDPACCAQSGRLPSRSSSINFVS